MNDKINRLLEKCLRIVFSDKTHLLKNYQIKMDLSQNTQEVYKNLLPAIAAESFCTIIT